MDRKKVIYIGLILILTVIVSITYFSYAFFTHKDEQRGKSNIITGTLNYKIESEDLNNNQITLVANEVKQIKIELTSLNNISSKYELYYETNNNSIKIGYDLSGDTPNGIIASHAKKTIILNLKNYSTTTSATVIFSVEGGFIGNTLVKSKGISIPTSTSLCSYTPNQAFNFTYANSSQVFDTDFCDGVYMVQLWGSSGKDVGSDGLSNSLGYGGYTAGKIRLEKSLVLYINVGNETIVSGHHTYNGGAVGEAIGGGATDIRLKSTSWNDSIGLNSRIMVAGGGGGAMYNNHLTLVQSGDAGGLIGYDAIANHDNPSRNDLGGHGGTQTAGGAGGTAISNWDPLTSNATGVFGAGGYGLNSNGGSPSSGGGGGYYGGGHGYHPGATWTGGGGGSSYISGHTGCVAVTSETNSSPKNGCVTSNTNYDCSVHYSKLYFYDTVMIDGKGYSWNSAKAAYVGQIQPDGSTTKGHYGTGYARITYLGD